MHQSNVAQWEIVVIWILLVSPVLLSGLEVQYVVLVCIRVEYVAEL